MSGACLVLSKCDCSSGEYANRLGGNTSVGPESGPRNTSAALFPQWLKSRWGKSNPQYVRLLSGKTVCPHLHDEGLLHPQNSRAPRQPPWQLLHSTISSHEQGTEGEGGGLWTQRCPPLSPAILWHPVVASTVQPGPNQSRLFQSLLQGSEHPAAIRLHAPAPSPARSKQNESIH